MRTRHILTAAVALFCASCAPLKTYYQPGVSVALLQKDTTNCKVKALNDVPPSTQIRRTPPRYIPGRRYCDSAGRCHIRGGFYVPGETYSYDPNDGLRKAVEQQCMAAIGYAPVSIPRCPESIKRAAPKDFTRTLPPLTASSCVIRNDDGSFLIVSRG